MGSHQSAKMLRDEWLTPPGIINSLGSFDLDPCSPVNRPWDTAKKHYSVRDDGLFQPWEGRVWLNPPYGKNINDWMNKMALHNYGISLVFARTETEWFHDYVWGVASGILFIRKRLYFYDVNGNQAKHNAGAPSVLISYRNNDALERCNISGKFVNLMNKFFIIVIDYSDKTWKFIVEKAMADLNGEGELKSIYDTVIKLAPDKVRNNLHFKEKIRQTLQKYFDNIDKGVWSNKLTA